MNAQLAVLLRERRYPPRGGFHRSERRGLKRSGLCLWVYTIAEVDGRHVAWEPWRKPVSELGLARKPARKRVSEAEPRRPSRGISGGREALVPSISAERGGVDSSVEGASGLEDGGDGFAVVGRILGAAQPSRLWSARKGGATGSVSDQITRLA